MKNCLIVSNGEIKDIGKTMHNLINYYCFDKKTSVISADGGVSNCIYMNIYPDLLIGDMDSVSDSDIAYLSSQNKKIKLVRFKHDKNESDTQLAIDYAIKKGYEKITIIGALGKRIDHSLANIFNLFSEKYGDIDLKIIDENWEIFVLKKSSVILGKPGNKISIFSMTPDTFFIETEGLAYRLANEKLLFSPIRGLSNIFTDDKAKIFFSDGILLIIKEI